MQNVLLCIVYTAVHVLCIVTWGIVMYHVASHGRVLQGKGSIHFCNPNANTAGTEVLKTPKAMPDIRSCTVEM